MKSISFLFCFLIGYINYTSWAWVGTVTLSLDLNLTGMKLITISLEIIFLSRPCQNQTQHYCSAWGNYMLPETDNPS